MNSNCVNFVMSILFNSKLINTVSAFIITIKCKRDILFFTQLIE